MALWQMALLVHGVMFDGFLCMWHFNYVAFCHIAFNHVAFCHIALFTVALCQMAFFNVASRQDNRKSDP